MASRPVIGLITGILIFSIVVPTSLPVIAISSQESHHTISDPIDRNLDSGSEFWRGSTLRFDGSEIVGNPSTASEDARTFQIRGVDDGDVGALVSEFTVGEDGLADVESTSMVGQFIIQHDGDNVYVEEGTGYLDPPDGEATVDRSAWTVVQQTYDSEWSDPTVYQGEFTSVNLTSNREAKTTIAVSADGLSFEDLTRLFSAADFAASFHERSDNDVLLLRSGAERTYEVAATGLSPGTYTLTFESTDTEASHQTSLRVNQGEKFASVERSDEAGDLIKASVKCSDCYLVVGGVDEGFVDLLDISDGNGDGRVDLIINTRYMGLYSGDSSVPSDIKPYSSSTDSVKRLSQGYQLSSRNTQDQLSTLRTDLGLDGQGRSAPMPSGPVDLTVTSSDFLIDRDTYGEHRAPLGGQLVVRDEQDVTTFDLQDPALGKVETYSQPSRAGLDRNLTKATNQRPSVGRVALGDRLIVRVDIAGIHGYIDQHGTDLSTVVDNQNEGIHLDISGSSGAGIPIDTEHNWMTVDEANDRLYIGIDTSRRAISREITVGQRYDVTMTLSGVDAAEYDLSGSENSFRGYPYVDAGESLSVQTTVRFVEPTASVDQPGTAVKVPNENPVKVTGSTALAPGSIMTITAKATGSATWQKSTSVTVSPNSTWTANLDFSNTKIGETFTITAKKQSTTLMEASGQVVEPSEVPEQTTPGTPNANNPGETTANDQPTNTPNSQSGTSTPSGADSGSQTDGSDSSSSGGGMFGFIPGNLLGGLSGLLVPIGAIVLVIGLIAIVVGRLR